MVWLFAWGLALASVDGPFEARVMTEDVERFYEVFETRHEPGFARRLGRDYLRAGSPALQKFRRRIGSARALARTVLRSEDYYIRLQPQLLALDESSLGLGDLYEDMAQIWPAAVFPDVHILVGRFMSGGTIADEGILIGGELFGRTAEVDGTALPGWLDEGLKSIDEVEAIVAHELIHYQQDMAEKHRLALVLEEGVADFFAELLVGRHINPVAHAYGEKHEPELQAAFCPGRHAEGAGSWLYVPSTEPGVPKDLGYYIGYRIAEDYVTGAADRTTAVRELLVVQDAEGILQASGWCEGY